MVSGIRNRLDLLQTLRRRFFRRTRPVQGPVTLDRRGVYILPSRSGWIFSLILLAMLIGAINYQNSLAFILTFLLTSLGFVSMIHAVRNLYGLRLHAGHAKSVFAGSDAYFPVNLENPGGIRRFSLKMMLPGQAPVTLDLPQNGAQWVDLSYPAQRRGYLQPGRITLYSRFPLGLFHVWSYINISMNCLIYPKPETSNGLPPQMLRSRDSFGDQGRGNDDFAFLRTYQPGDSLRHIHWKALAREQGLMTKQFGGDISEEMWLDWEQLGNLTLEARLSRLTRWVIEADSLGLRYGLKLPHREIPLATGKNHYTRCLEALATFGLTEESEGEV